MVDLCAVIVANKFNDIVSTSVLLQQAINQDNKKRSTTSKYITTWSKIIYDRMSGKRITETSAVTLNYTLMNAHAFRLEPTPNPPLCTESRLPASMFTEIF